MTVRLSRRHLLASPLALSPIGSRLPGRAVSLQGASPVPGPIPERGWPFYGHDLLATRATSTAGITSTNVDSLVPTWETPVDGPVSATPVIAENTIYVGSYDGRLYALDLFTGERHWMYETGSAVPEPNLQIPLGITGSAAVVDGIVYVGDAAAVVHAVDVPSGEARWTATVDTQPNASIWSSPVLAQGQVLVGVASVAKEPGLRGSVVALDAETGEVLWQSYMVPKGADGAGVFAVPAVDVDRGRVYVGTQNAYSPTPAPYGNPISVVALDLASVDLVWSFNAPPGGGDTAPTDDVGFSASPQLFSAEIDGRQRQLVGEGQKSGEYWALDRESGEVVWQASVSPPGFLGGMEGSSAVADGFVAVPATDWTAFEGPASGMVTGLSAATGDTLWRVEQEAPAASPASISNDVVFHAGMDGILHAYHLVDGTELWSHNLEASVSGGIGIAAGVLVLGAATPQFAPFVLPGDTIRAFAIGMPGATPVDATPAS